MSDRSEKITFAAMRASGVRGLLVYCCDYQCSRSLAISGDPWPEISGFPISSLDPSSRPVASAAPTCDRINWNVQRPKGGMGYR